MPHEERINVALSRLLEQTVPVYPHDDNEAVEQRLDDVFTHASALIDS